MFFLDNCIFSGAKVNPEVIAQEEEEARKYAYIGEAVDSKKDLLEGRFKKFFHPIDFAKKLYGAFYLLSFYQF